MNPLIAGIATLILLYRALSKNSLTRGGILAALVTAGVHAYHPWSAPFILLISFFVTGNAVTKIKHDIKARITVQASGGAGSPGPRGYIQVVANSLAASALLLLHAWKLQSRKQQCLSLTRPHAADILVFGFVTNYLAVTADTFSSELGILSTTPPRLITQPWKLVAPGTNGGVTSKGLQAAVAGSFFLSGMATTFLPFCEDTPFSARINFMSVMSMVGVAGSLLDSLLGATLQASVADADTGKIVEGDGGRKVLVLPPTRDNQRSASREVVTGRDVLSNNGVNLLMASIMSLLAMVGAAIWFRTGWKDVIA